MSGPEEGSAKGAQAGKVPRERVEKAVAALLKWVRSQQSKSKAQLVEDEDMFYVVLSLRKTPEHGRTNAHSIPIPHSLYPLDAGREICLLVKDSKDEGHKKAKERIKVEGGSGVTKVIGVQKLRTNYKPYEAKRQLCGSFDFFLADDRIIPVLPKLLGKTFFKKKKHPVPVNLRGAKWAEKIRAACSCTYLYLSEGPCVVVRAARCSFSQEEIVENVLEVVKGAAELVPRKWKNVQSIYVKTQESASLPLYQALPDMPLKIR